MNRILELLRGQLAGSAEPTDHHLLDHFLAGRDEAAFAELVRRYGRVVWGVCRRLANYHDAEDAFQATFLVLVRRANRLGRDVPLGPWLHRVAVMTARNVIRGNRRRAAVTRPLEHDVPATAACGVADCPDLDAALLALPERYRVPVVLCHLQGLSRREAAMQLGCPEGTLSARLARALARLRARLGAGAPAILATAGATAVPAGLSAAAVRVAAIFTTSTLTAAGVSPAVAGLTDGVLRMFWMKKLTAGLALSVVVAGGLFAGLAGGIGAAARATDPEPNVPLVGDPQALPEEPDAALKRLNKQIEDLRKQKELLGAMEMDLFAEKDRIEAAKNAKAAAAAAAELGDAIAIEITGGEPAFVIREVVNGKVARVACTDLDILTTYLRRALNDPKGPKKLRVSAHKDQPYDQLKQVFAACAAAGYAKATFSHEEPRYTLRHMRVEPLYVPERVVINELYVEPEPAPKPGEIDLKQYVPKKP
jgi:RNA polymerase sigma factor (sigma-70 family)